MANIIEQQDLLKGLPDARLSLLLQKPDATIPPFLVAAEAQRRQSIRQQFAGAGEKESVVDTLTKQMANVPQNIQASPQTPPQMPKPQMGGIGALPQAQQGMANGGPVRRFAAGSIVTPTVQDLAAGITALSPEEYVRRKREEQIKALGPGRARYLLENPTTPTTEAQQAENQLRAATEGPFSSFYSPESVYEAAQDLKSVTERTATPPAAPKEDEADGGTPQPTSNPPSSTAGTDDTSPENKYKAMEADMRKRLEGLYAAEEPSNWENAQKWFAMSQQIMNPDASLMEGLVNAGSAYAEISGNQAAEERQSARAREEALLNWDMQIMQSDRSAEAAAAAKAEERAYNERQRQMPEATDALRAYHDMIQGIDKQLEDPMGMMDEATKNSLLQQRRMYEAQIANIMKQGGFGSSGVVTIDDVNAAVGAGAR